eukprot:68504-Chlamydomonas_euryale.AAC.1
MSVFAQPLMSGMGLATTRLNPRPPEEVCVFRGGLGKRESESNSVPLVCSFVCSFIHSFVQMICCRVTARSRPCFAASVAQGARQLAQRRRVAAFGRRGAAAAHDAGAGPVCLPVGIRRRRRLRGRRDRRGPRCNGGGSSSRIHAAAGGRRRHYCGN